MVCLMVQAKVLEQIGYASFEATHHDPDFQPRGVSLENLWECGTDNDSDGR